MFHTDISKCFLFPDGGIFCAAGLSPLVIHFLLQNNNSIWSCHVLVSASAFKQGVPISCNPLSLFISLSFPPLISNKMVYKLVCANASSLFFGKLMQVV